MKDQEPENAHVSAVSYTNSVNEASLTSNGGWS
jgi:hypothetical protein